MMRFIAGIAVCLVVEAIGWPRIEAALNTAQRVTERAYTAAQAEVQGGGK